MIGSAIATDICHNDEGNKTVASLISALDKEFMIISKDNKLLNFYNNREYLDGDNFISATEIEKRQTLYLTSLAWLFKDINNMVWKYSDNQAENNIYKKLINYHCKEDGSHYLYHKHDFTKLGLDDINIRSTDLLLYFFGDLTIESRKIIYKLIYYDGLINGEENPIGRYILMQAFEITGYWIFESFRENYNRYLRETRNNYQLRYIGNLHINLEPGTIHSTHESGENDAELIFGKIQLTNEQYNKYFKYGVIIMKHTANHFWVENYKFITKKFNQQNFFNNLVDSINMSTINA